MHLDLLLQLFAVSFVWSNVLLLAHEGGHYLTARGLGFIVRSVDIGSGPAIARFCDRTGAIWSFRLFPIFGSVRFLNMDGSSPKLFAQFAIILAGPFANFVLASVPLIVSSIFFREFSIGLPRHFDGIGPAACLLLAYVSMSFGAVNLLPIPPLAGC